MFNLINEYFEYLNIAIIGNEQLKTSLIYDIITTFQTKDNDEIR